MFTSRQTRIQLGFAYRAYYFSNAAGTRFGSHGLCYDDGIQVPA